MKDHISYTCQLPSRVLHLLIWSRALDAIRFLDLPSKNPLKVELITNGFDKKKTTSLLLEIQAIQKCDNQSTFSYKTWQNLK
jgi:hypothetical protein